jgi:hypothetical protein
MFEHFRAILANTRNQKTLMLVGGFIILLIVLKHFGLYEGFQKKDNAVANSEGKLEDYRDRDDGDDDK